MGKHLKMRHVRDRNWIFRFLVVQNFRLSAQFTDTWKKDEGCRVDQDQKRDHLWNPQVVLSKAQLHLPVHAV